MFTNLDIGDAVTGKQKFLSKDLRVTDNGDGTADDPGHNAANVVVYSSTAKPSPGPPADSVRGS